MQLPAPLHLELLLFVLLAYSEAFRYPPVRPSFFQSTFTSLHGAVSQGPSMFGGDAEESNDIDDDDDAIFYHPEEPTWAEMFPQITAATLPEMDRDAPDWESLRVDDPLFLDMPWPEERGPEASAFARHMAWKRSLSDQERKQWQKWAVYSRVMMKDKFDFSLEDFILQSLLRDANTRSLEARDFPFKKKLWSSIALGYADEEEAEIISVIGALYSAFNRRNFDAIRELWLPDDCVELGLPGYSPARGHSSVDKLYKRVVNNAKPFGSVSHRILNVTSMGYIAVAYVEETVGAGTALKSVKGKTRSRNQQLALRGSSDAPTKSGDIRLFTVLVLRKWNKMWRVMKQHSKKFKFSSAAGDESRKTSPKSKLTDRQQTLAKLMNYNKNVNPAERVDLESLLLGGLQAGAGSISMPTSADQNTRRKSNADQGHKALKTRDGREWKTSKDGGKSMVAENSNGSEIAAKVEPKKDRGEPGSAFISSGRDGLERQGEERVDSDEGKKDKNVSIGRLTVMALRTLYKKGSISRAQKDMLLQEMVQNVDYETGTSRVEVAFDLLVLRNQEKSEGGSGDFDVGDLEEFADHCSVLCEGVWDKEPNSGSIYDADDYENDEYVEFEEHVDIEVDVSRDDGNE